MKLKKHISGKASAEQTDNAEKIRLRRRQEKLRNDELRAENIRTAIFKRKVREASLQKAPKTLRTKGYYRFTRDYPSEVTPDGFRENTPESKKLSGKQKILLLVLCIAVFCLSFAAVNVGIAISEKNAGTKNEPPVINEEAALKGLHIAPENLRALSTEEISRMLISEGCNMAVIEFKDEDGYIYFDINRPSDDPAVRIISSAEEKIKELQAQGILCAAYISCFRDTVAASELSGLEVKNLSGKLFTDTERFSWIDPFSEDARNYVLDIISQAKKYSFDYIFLDNICFPVNYTSEAPLFEKNADKSSATISFINDAVKLSDDSDIVIIGDITGFTAISTIPDEKYGAPILSSSGNAFCLDLRSGYKNEAQIKSSEKFKYLNDLPLAFILESGSLANETLTQTKEASILFAMVDKSLEDGTNYVNHSGIKNVIIWQ